MKWGLEDGVIEKIYNTLKEFESVQEVWIFGSRARGDFKPTSDIDLVLVSHNLDFSDFLKLKIQL
jgi:predicted nucleotidyltransferase